MKKYILGTIFALLCTSCASLPPLNFSVPDVGVSTHKINAELKSINVTFARPEEKKGTISAGMSEVPQIWEKALADGLERMAIFQDGAPRTATISVKILAINVPLMGASMKTKSIARYEILDRNTGAVVYTRDFESEGLVPFNYAYMGAIRVQESVNRSVQNNIAAFLDDIQKVDITKPMFDAPK